MMTAAEELQKKRKNGQIAIISAGFRCFTKIEISKQLGVEQESLAFDSGFFPPAAIARMLATEEVNLTRSHTACIKTENFEHPEHGLGIRFEQSTYADIDRLATAPNMPGINQFLDNTFGYYTVDQASGYVLAHYNWHKFGAGKGGRVHDVAGNIVAIGELLTKRLNRIRDKCRAAKTVILVVGETQGYRHMMIDDRVFMLGDVALIAESVRRQFGDKCRIVTLADVATPQMALELV